MEADGRKAWPSMTFPPRIVLHAPIAHRDRLRAFVERCLRDGVRLIAIVGAGAETLEEEIDWIVVGDGPKPSRFIVTSSHPNERLEDVLEFAAGWRCDGEDGLEEVRL